jgi:integrase
MKFEDNLITLLKNKGLSENTINLYMTYLHKLNDNNLLKNIKFLRDPLEIIEKIKDYKETTQRNIIISIVSILKVLDEKKLYDEYYKLMIERTKNINDKPKNEKTETQKKNWMSWDDIMIIYNDLLKNLKLSKNMDDTKYEKLLHFLVLSLYVLLPPRRNQDYLKMKITNKPEGVNDNFLDLKKKQFVFNVYKTSKKDGQVIINIPDNLFKILKLYIKHHPKLDLLKKEDIPFLVYFNGDKLTLDNSITRILNKIFNKKIGASMLRHIYLSNKYSKIINEQEKDSKMMSHNLQTQKDYVKI